MTTAAPLASSLSVPLAVKPWYREPWPWLLMAGPFVAVVGCAITIYLAYTQFGNQPIVAGVVKRGLVIEQVDASAGNAGPAVTPAR